MMEKRLTYILLIVLGFVFVGADNATTIASNTASNNNATGQTVTTVVNAGTDTTVPPPAPTTTDATDPCTESIENTFNCTACVLTSNCTYIQELYGGKCTGTPGEDQFTLWISRSVAECASNGTIPTSTTTTTAAPATNDTTSTQTPTTTTPTTTTTTTTAATTKPTSPTPAISTTLPPPPTAVPTVAPGPSKGGSWGWGSFFSGIVFTAGLSAVGYVVWRFHKRRSEGNYHTL